MPVASDFKVPEGEPPRVSVGGIIVTLGHIDPATQQWDDVRQIIIDSPLPEGVEAAVLTEARVQLDSQLTAENGGEPPSPDPTPGENPA